MNLQQDRVAQPVCDCAGHLPMKPSGFISGSAVTQKHISLLGFAQTILTSLAHGEKYFYNVSMGKRKAVSCIYQNKSHGPSMPGGWVISSHEIMVNRAQRWAYPANDTQWPCTYADELRAYTSDNSTQSLLWRSGQVAFWKGDFLSLSVGTQGYPVIRELPPFLASSVFLMPAGCLNIFLSFVLVVSEAFWVDLLVWSFLLI